MKTYLSRLIPVVVAAGLALAMLALGFLAALGVRSLVAGTASASPAAPNPGHEWSQVEGHGVDPDGRWLGTTTDQPLELRVNGERALRLEPNASSPNLIGGYSGNSVTDGAGGATIGGGGDGWAANRVTDNYGAVGGGVGNVTGDDVGTTNDAWSATVAGGQQNTASGALSAVGGGEDNTASGWAASVGGGLSNTASDEKATVSGGTGNQASSWGASIGGGDGNVVSAPLGTVGGGRNNSASGGFATVGGGYMNTATGENSSVGGGNGNRVTDDLATVAGGGNNLAGDAAGTTSDATCATVGGGWSNTASGGTSTVAGGANNTASGWSSTVSGGYTNTASGGLSTVAGGNGNSASGAYATVSGGQDNTASGVYDTVSGGQDNTASGTWATVAGGYDNDASGYQATVGGGWLNTASGYQATVGGGNHNTASGWSSTVPGGQDNSAQESFSFAAGQRAKADDIGAFVWADSKDFDFASTANNEFSARATGGARFVSGIDGAGNPTAGVTLAAGGGSWSSISDRNVKANFTSVDGRDVLERLASIPIETWNYKAQDASIRHMGPMAQDFYAAFGLGESETTISTVDADGVALAAIQGLYQRSQEQAARIQALEAQNASLQQRLDGLEARVSALEGTGVSAAVSQASSSGPPTPWLLLGGGLTLALGGLVLVQRRLVGGRR
jgi:hypothetical protein